jgi:hypothetical protein
MMGAKRLKVVNTDFNLLRRLKSRRRSFGLIINGLRMLRPFTWMVVALVAVPILPQARDATERFISDNTVISRRDPEVAIKLPRAVHYAGTDRFQLSDPKLGNFDACELYAFVDPDNDRRVDKFYWVQFEAYLPNHPGLHHTYDSPRHVVIGGLDFFVDSGVLAAHRSLKPGSDEAHFYGLLASQGYRWSDLMYVRLVHLFDAAKRKELMIIYAENLAPTGYTATQLDKEGSGHAKWAAISHELARRAERSITITAGNPLR